MNLQPTLSVIGVFLKMQDCGEILQFKLWGINILLVKMAWWSTSINEWESNYLSNDVFNSEIGYKLTE